MDILNLDEHFKDNMSDMNRDKLVEILEEFKRGHYPNVLSKSAALQDEIKTDQDLFEKLKMVDAICHAEIGEMKAASDIIYSLYLEEESDLALLGELAFMCDYKLARRIMSAAVKQMEGSDEADHIKLARGYLLLAEVEEKLEKFARSIKYYQRGMKFFQEDDNRGQYMTLYIHFKIGMLYSMQNNGEESVSYLHKVIDKAGESNPELKIKSLVSIAKTYGSQNQTEAAYPYLEEALQMLEGSTLENTLAHAEALTEKAFNFFEQSKLDEAVPYYRDAISVYKKLPYPSHRQLGMIYMQYAYCLEHMDSKKIRDAGLNYENAIERLEMTQDRQLLENALADVIAFFDRTENDKQKRIYEEKFVKMTNANANA